MAEATEAERFPRLLFETIITSTDDNLVRDSAINQSLTYIQIIGVEKETQAMHEKVVTGYRLDCQLRIEEDDFKG